MSDNNPRMGWPQAFVSIVEALCLLGALFAVSNCTARALEAKHAAHDSALEGSE